MRLQPSLILLMLGSAAFGGDRKDALVLRSADPRLTVTAAPKAEAVRIDGALDDAVWSQAAPITAFVQSEPKEGEPATEPTEVFLAHDRDNLYVAAYCHDAAAPVVNNIREDFQPGEQDSFEVIFDTFADHRNGFLFITNPEGARSDQQVANEGKGRTRAATRCGS